MEKAYDLMREGRADVRQRSRLLHGKVPSRPDKALRVSPAELRPLPSCLESHVPEKDRYLVQACLAADVHTLVTSDHELVNALRGCDGEGSVRALLRDEFVPEYPPSSGRRPGIGRRRGRSSRKPSLS